MNDYGQLVPLKPKVKSENYYERLGLSMNATQEEIVASYHRLAKKYHPDLNPNEDTESIMKKINEAYDILSDLEKRKEYDKTLNKKNQEPTNNNAYKSYTKTREESESDLDNWLKDYLNSRRHLANLYKKYIKIEKANIALRRGYIKPSPLDEARADLLLKEIIKEIVALSNKNGTRPTGTLSFLLAELEPIYNIRVGYRQDCIPIPPEIDIRLNLLLSEIGSFIKTYSEPNNEYYQEFLKYILRKYLEVCEIIADYGWRHPSYSFNNYLKESFENIIKNNKEAINKILEGKLGR